MFSFWQLFDRHSKVVFNEELECGVLERLTDSYEILQDFVLTEKTGLFVPSKIVWYFVKMLPL